MKADEIQAHLEQAMEIAEAAGPIALRYFRRPIEVTDKSQGQAFDPVTRADREIEAFVRDELGRRFPDYGIVGEEGRDQPSPSSRRWVIDPIDGTRAFISGMPAWGILLGLMDADQAILGVMHQPYMGETFYGSGLEGSGGSWLQSDGNDTELRTRKQAKLAEATLYCTHPSMFQSPDEKRAFAQIADSCRLVRFGGDCYAYCLLALGLVDLVVESSLQPYDILPLIPIIEGAGGIVTNAEGGRVTGGGFVIAAGNQALHAQALEAARPLVGRS